MYSLIKDSTIIFFGIQKILVYDWYINGYLIYTINLVLDQTNGKIKCTCKTTKDTF